MANSLMACKHQTPSVTLPVTVWWGTSGNTCLLEQVHPQCGFPAFHSWVWVGKFLSSLVINSGEQGWEKAYLGCQAKVLGASTTHQRKLAIVSLGHCSFIPILVYAVFLAGNPRTERSSGLRYQTPLQICLLFTVFLFHIISPRWTFIPFKIIFISPGSEA